MTTKTQATRLLKKFIESQPVHNNHLNNFVEIGFKPNQTKNRLNEACYSPLLRKSDRLFPVQYVGVYTDRANPRLKVRTTVRKEWFKFLMHEHPLSYCVVKTPLAFAEEYGMLVACDYTPSDHVGYMLKAIRLAWEYPNLVERWLKLVQEYKADKRVAFYLASCFQIIDDEMLILYNPPGHSIFTGGRESVMSELDTFIKGEYNTADYFSDSGWFYGSQEVFKVHGKMGGTLEQTALDCSHGTPKKTGTCPFSGKPVYSENKSIKVTDLVTELHKRLGL